MKRGDPVVITNPKHKHHGRRGIILDMDRGNVTVGITAPNGTPAADVPSPICTRMASLAPATDAPLLTFTKESCS